MGGARARGGGQMTPAAGVWAGDWRVRFGDGLPSLGELALFSFDPYMFDRNGSGRNAANMDPIDLDLVCGAVDATNADVFVQLSTYSANNNNPQSAVTEIVASALQRAGLHLLSCVRADGNMMSLVFGRDLRYASDMEALPARFLSWLTAAKGASAREGLRRAR